MSQACPMCGSGSSAVIGQLKRTDLRKIWIRELGIDPIEWIATPTIEYQHCVVCDLRYFDDGLAGPEEMYRELEEIPWYYLDNKPEFDIAIRHLAGVERILEIGAGEGTFGRLISGRDDYVGLELNSSAADQAVASGLDVRRESLADHARSAPELYRRGGCISGNGARSRGGQFHTGLSTLHTTRGTAHNVGAFARWLHGRRTQQHPRLAPASLDSVVRSLHVRGCIPLRAHVGNSGARRNSPLPSGQLLAPEVS